MAVPVYLFTGPEFGERNDAVEQLKKQAEKKFGELDYHLLYAGDTSVSEVLGLLENGNLFSSARFIVLRNAESIKQKEDIARLGDWVKTITAQKADDAWLFLVSDETAVDKKLEALVPKENRRIFWELFDDRKEQWVRDYFRKNGFGVEDAAVEAILNMVENNTEALRTECSRFFICLEKGHTVTVADVEAILAHNRTENAFTLFDALADSSHEPSQRLEEALEILQKIRHSKESNAIQLLAGLSWSFKKLREWQSLFQDSSPSDFDLKTHGFGSKKVQGKYRMASRVWKLPQTSLIVSSIAAADMQIRSGGTAAEETVLQGLLYSIVMHCGAPLASWETD